MELALPDKGIQALSILPPRPLTPASLPHPSGNVGSEPGKRRGWGEEGIWSTQDLPKAREAEHPRTANCLCTVCYPAAVKPRERHTHTRVRSRGSPPSSAQPVGDGDSGAACFSWASPFAPRHPLPRPPYTHTQSPSCTPGTPRASSPPRRDPQTCCVVDGCPGIYLVRRCRNHNSEA